MFEPSATPRKISQEVQELERLVNNNAIRNNREQDFRFIRGRHFRDNSDNELIFCILAYVSILGGKANKAQDFRGVEATFHGYRLKIFVDVDRPGKAEFIEKRETVELTVHSFAQFKKIIDEL